MLYKENISNDWLYFYDTIEGFDYEEGHTYELEVMVSQIENPTEDGSSLKYSLIKVISKEKEKSIGQNVTINDYESQENSLITVEYQALTRATFFQININKDTIEKTTDRNLKNIDSRKCSKKDWETIITLTEAIALEKISQLKAPSGKRLFDGAAHAQLKIISKNKTYTSASFDHGNPPKEIEQLVKTILSLSESIE
ncbi:hypothetical protein GCM10022259_07680 [Aquimarina mytili]